MEILGKLEAIQSLTGSTEFTPEQKLSIISTLATSAIAIKARQIQANIGFARNISELQRVVCPN